MSGRMAKNLVRSHRKACGLTQRELAKKAGTSHQQIQAIEAYDKSLQLDLALRICATLGQPVEAVFPSMEQAATLLGQAQDPVRIVTKSVEFAALVKWAGLLPATNGVETLCCRMRGGHFFQIQMDAEERARVWRSIQTTKGDHGFILIDSIDGCRYAINVQHLLLWKWLDALSESGVTVSRGPASTGLRIWLVDGGEPLDYEVAEDEPNFAEEHVGQLWDLFTFLQDQDHEPRHLGRQDFIDRHGEHVFFHKADAVVVAAPLALIGSEEGMPWDNADAEKPGTKDR